MEEKSLSDQYLEHCLTSTPTLEGVKAFLFSNECYIYARYLEDENEENRRQERLFKRYKRLGKLEAKTEIISNLLLSKNYSVQYIADSTKTKIEFVERIKSKFNL